MHHLSIQRLRIESLQFPEEFLYYDEVPRFHWDAVFECIKMAGRHGCRVVLDGHFGDHMMYSDAHLVGLARRLRWVQFRREFAALTASTTDADPSGWGPYFRQALFRDITPAFMKPMARRLEAILHPDKRPSWYDKGFRECALRRRIKQRRPKGNFFSNHSSSRYGMVTSSHCLNVLEENSKISSALGFEKSYPFMDQDLIAFMMAIPDHVVNWQGRSKGLFREAMRGILPESIRERNWKADFTFLPNDAARKDYPRFQACLQPGCSAVGFGYLDPVGLQNEFSMQKDKLKADASSVADRVTGTVALELWLKVFFRKEAPKFSGGVA